MIIEKPFGVPVVESEQRTCPHHKKHPLDRNYPGCTCSGTYRIRYEPAGGTDAPE